MRALFLYDFDFYESGCCIVIDRAMNERADDGAGGAPDSGPDDGAFRGLVLRLPDDAADDGACTRPDGRTLPGLAGVGTPQQVRSG